ncbi:MAG TPA: carbohydrate-binding protein [Opitutaceae bacterium]|nr:carbohydrate-binding protein [Opitutaceae bacterium]
MSSLKSLISATYMAGAAFLSSASLHAASNTNWKFDFGSGPVQSGYTQVLPTTAYNSTAGYGFASTSGLSSVNRGAPDSLRGDYITGSSFKFSANVPAGNYNVTVITGDNSGTSDTSIKSEVERIIVQQLKTTSGQFSTYSITLHIKSDGVLDLTFYGTAPKINAVEISPATTAITLYIAGDSTVCDQNSTTYAGWGQMFTSYLTQGAAVANYADSGETSTSFWGGFYVPNIQGKIKSGDYLFIQFGHNDEKSLTLAQYKAGLKRYVDDAKAKGAKPVLITPLERNVWSGGTLTHSHGQYPATVQQLATETNTPCIDLTTKSYNLYSSMGATQSATLFVSGDKTHTNQTGALRVAGLVRDGINELNLSPLESLLAGATPVDPLPAGSNYQAENATLSGGVTIDTNSAGYQGTGFANFPTTGGTVTFNNVAGNGGGTKSLGIRYALGGTTSRTGSLTVNGVPTNITFPTTGAFTTWATLQVNVTLNNSSTNTISLASTGSDLANVDYINIPPAAVGAADVYPAENATRGGSTPPTVETTNAGYNDTGYVNFGTTTSTLTFSSVNPNGGGTKAMTIRYALSATTSRTGTITVNGVTSNLTFNPTASWTTWTTMTVNITLSATGTNTIQIASTGSDLANVDEISIPW